MSDFTGSVLFVLPRLDRGGAQKMQAFVANACVEASDFSRVLLVTTHEHIVQQNLRSGVEHVSLADGRPVRLDGPLRRLFGYARIVVRLRKLIKRMRPNIVCAFRVKYAFIALLACLGLQTTVVGAERGSPQHLSTFWWRFSKIVYRRCDGVVFQLEAVRQLYPHVVSRSTVIPNPSISPGERKRICAQDRAPVISSALARWDALKGIDTLLRAFHMILRHHPSYSLWLFGPEDGREPYEALTQELGIAGSVSFREPVSDVATAIQATRAFVLPSRHEGIPNVLLEALGAGVPTVSCDCPPGGPRLLTGSGSRGLLVPVDDVEAMAIALDNLIGDDALSDRLSAAAFGVHDEFDQGVIARMWVDFFVQVASSNLAGRERLRRV